MTRPSNLTRGATDGHRRPLERHGVTAGGRTNGTPEYAAWKAMWARCTNPHNERWHRYGKRGIRVCDRWRSFENFLADMGKRPGPGYSIDRENNDGHYRPSNCRWATRKQQAANRCTSIKRAA